MIDIPTLKKLRQAESISKTKLNKLPDNYLSDCINLLNLAVQENDLSEVSSIMTYVRTIAEIRQTKILAYAIYDGNSYLRRYVDVENILEEEKNLLIALEGVIVKHNQFIDSKFDGHYLK